MLKVLVVDDSRFILDYVEKLTVDLGHQVMAKISNRA